MTTLYAQPYDITATGFYFETAEQYAALAKKARNDYGQPVEELEIQFIDGEALDAELAQAWGLNQATFAAFLDAAADWEDHSKIRLIIAIREGIGFNAQTDDIDALEVDIYGVETMRELAEQFVDDGLFGDIPEALRGYIDYEAIARDLAMDYSEIAIAGERLIYRCG
ncbi:MAG: antirestriction protein ArdA [Alphaproteobacteria bacterium]|nr:antirestriction protein ArdA [Alphaproteobacteria bacterium]